MLRAAACLRRQLHIRVMMPDAFLRCLLIRRLYDAIEPRLIHGASASARYARARSAMRGSFATGANIRYLCFLP